MHLDNKSAIPPVHLDLCKFVWFETSRCCCVHAAVHSIVSMFGTPKLGLMWVQSIGICVTRQSFQPRLSTNECLRYVQKVRLNFPAILRFKFFLAKNSVLETLSMHSDARTCNMNGGLFNFYFPLPKNSSNPGTRSRYQIDIFHIKFVVKIVMFE